jgi:hypothetical protein
MEIDCLFTTGFRIDQYECIVNRASSRITQRCEVKSFNGHHEVGKSNKDVECLRLEQSTIHYLPSGIYKIFPNMKRLFINQCGLKELNSNDFFGLGSLEKLFVTNNNLKMLPDDLFIHTRQLQEINFNTNKLTHLSSRLLDFPDEQLVGAAFLRNTNINTYYWAGDNEGLDSIEELQVVIDSSCWPPPKQLQPKVRTITNEPKKIPESFVSDFSLIVDSSEIRVHKKVLAAKSSYFAEKFKNDSTIDKLEIEGCSKEVVEEFLNCLYYDRGIKTEFEKVASELFILASTFKVEELKKIFEALVVKNLHGYNAVEVLKIGNRHQSDLIIEAAFAKVKIVYPKSVRSQTLKHKPENVEQIVTEIKRFKKTIHDLNFK